MLDQILIKVQNPAHETISGPVGFMSFPIRPINEHNNSEETIEHIMLSCEYT